VARTTDRRRQTGATAVQTALLVAAACAVGVLIALALIEWFGRLS
jgi:hypothetical protein